MAGAKRRRDGKTARRQVDESRSRGVEKPGGRGVRATPAGVAGESEKLPSGDIVYTLGGVPKAARGNPARRGFPPINREKGESPAAHLGRVTRALHEAIAQGGTHLVVPRELADWLGDHPQLADYLAEQHELADADAETGIVFALRPPDQTLFDVEVTGWHLVAGDGITLTAERRLLQPRVTLRPRQPVRGMLRGQLRIVAERLRTLRLNFFLTRPDRRQARRLEAVLSLARVGYLFHDLPYFAATFDEDGSVLLEFDLKLVRGRSLDRIELDLVEEDNWRVHPGFPGGKALSLPAAARAGARLVLRDVALTPAPRARKSPPYGVVRGPRPAPHRTAPGQPRDAVIFSSWVPREGLLLGNYFIETLRRWHADSKIFVGVNHGASPRWIDRLRRSGLDVTIQHAGPDLTMPYDPTGFVAALDAYRHCEENFALVWFGHNKGGDHLDNPEYAAGRWMIERLFWSRRGDIERYFDDPVVGLYTPHYLMMLQEHLNQTDALTRMYPAACAPLHVMAVSTHFVMRDESVRDFCARVDRQFFRYGPEPFGGDRYFFEMAMPNVPLMQGYEPLIEPGLGGTTGPAKVDDLHSVLSDWRQNHAVVAFELDKWRQNPTHFRTRHREHRAVD